MHKMSQIVGPVQCTKVMRILCVLQRCIIQTCLLRLCSLTALCVGVRACVRACVRRACVFVYYSYYCLGSSACLWTIFRERVCTARHVYQVCVPVPVPVRVRVREHLCVCVSVCHLCVCVCLCVWNCHFF